MSGGVAFVPDDFVVPRELVTDAFRLEPLRPEHNVGDYQAWISSIEHIRSTPGFAGLSWPRPMTLEDNLEDLQQHASDFAARSGFTYTVLAGTEIVGCVYIYPLEDAAEGARARSWVRVERAELDVSLHDAVSAWLREAWPFTRISYAPRR